MEDKKTFQNISMNLTYATSYTIDFEKSIGNTSGYLLNDWQ